MAFVFMPKSLIKIFFKKVQEQRTVACLEKLPARLTFLDLYPFV